MFRACHPLQLVVGPIIWALWFVTIYAALSVVCSAAPPVADTGPFTWLNGLLLVLTLLTTLLLVVAGARCWRASRTGSAREEFFTRVSAGVYLLTAASTLLIGMPVAVLPPCL